MKREECVQEEPKLPPARSVSMYEPGRSFWKASRERDREARIGTRSYDARKKHHWQECNSQLSTPQSGIFTLE